METAPIIRAEPEDTSLPVIGPDYSAAKEFLDIMHPDEKVCFQTVPRNGLHFRGKAFHGYLNELWDELVAWNLRGADVYCMVNQSNSRSNNAVTAITSFFVSVHGAPVDRVAALPIKPHVIVITGPSSWQAHWRIQPVPVTHSNRPQVAELFRRVQTALAMKVGGYPNLTDLARCAHVPGFFTYKDEPYQVGLRSTSVDPFSDLLSVAPVS